MKKEVFIEIDKMKCKTDDIAHEIMEEQTKKYNELKENGRAMIKAFAEYLWWKVRWWKWLFFIIGLMIGAMLGIFCMGLLAAQKENEMINETPKVIFCRTNDTNVDNIRTVSLKHILTNDIEFYEKLYRKSYNPYYLGRIDQCKFILKIVKGECKEDGFKNI